MLVMAKTTSGILSYMTRHRTAANLFLLVMLDGGSRIVPTNESHSSFRTWLSTT